MSECKHGLRSGCVYCHVAKPTPASRPAVPAAPRGAPFTEKRRAKATRLSEQMNDRMTTLKQRLKQIRGQ